MDHYTYTNIFPPGTKVRLSNSGGSVDGIQAIVTEVLILGSQVVRYNVSWYNGRSRQSEWVERYEVESVELEKSRTIGFIPQGGDSP